MRYPLFPIPLFVALVIIGFHTAVTLFQRRKPVVGEAAEIFLGVTGVFSGVRVFIQCTTEPSLPMDSEDKSYFALGAIALFWVSAETILARFKRAWRGL